MSRNQWSETRIARMIKEGRGKGEFNEYRPWLQAQEVSSLGLATRHYCMKTGRQHEYLSKGESDFHSMLAWHEDVIDIREQYPLSRDVTRRFAAELAIRHPFYPGTHVETVMTIDFLVVRLRDGQEVIEAYDIKCADDLEDPRTVEKLEIVRAALQNVHIPHHVVCTESLPKRKVAHLQWIEKGAVMPGEVGVVAGFFDDYSERMLHDMPRAAKTLRLNQYCESFDHRYSVNVGTGLRLARILMARRKLLPDFQQPELENAPLGSFAIATTEQLQLAVGGSR